jgi:hypothetical protein
MRDAPAMLTPTYLMAASSNVLEAGGYQRISKGFPEWSTSMTRLFEDEYNVVGIAVFATCGELLRSWAGLQASLVDVISRQVGTTESKAWDGYLVLMTTGVAPLENLEIESIRYDTTRLRKLVMTGEDLNESDDVDRLLRSLLPLRNQESLIKPTSALDMLPNLLASHGVKSEIALSIVEAFRNQKPLMDAFYRDRGTP